MGGQFLFELLQDRTFLLFLSDFSELSGEQVGQTGIDLIYHQIGTVAGSAAVLQHGNGFCPCFIVLRDTPVIVLALDGYVIKLELPELKELVSLMRRSSSNLNQLTRKVHETGRVYDADLEDISQRQEQLWEGVKEILTQLSKVS